MRRFSLIDQILTQINHGLTTVFTIAPHSRPNPADNIIQKEQLTDSEIRNSIGCMRVNHTGEVCAQALYRGQLLVSQHTETKEMLEKSCEEETDHLAWTKQRLTELEGKISVLNPFFYMNAYFLGVIAGLAGDSWSLGFVEETEIQVAKHLENHLDKLSLKDEKSRAIVAKMREEEMEHEKAAKRAGAKELPFIIKKMMQIHAKVMTTIVYRF